jgi:hypothetical protein
LVVDGEDKGDVLDAIVLATSGATQTELSVNDIHDAHAGRSWWPGDRRVRSLETVVQNRRQDFS